MQILQHHHLPSWNCVTLRRRSRACLVQVDEVEVTEHCCVLVRAQEQMERVIDWIGGQPVVVVCTVLDEALRNLLEQASRRMNVPFIPVLDQLLGALGAVVGAPSRRRPEEHTSELQSLMRISYAVFCLKKKK